MAFTCRCAGVCTERRPWRARRGLAALGLWALGLWALGLWALPAGAQAPAGGPRPGPVKVDTATVGSTHTGDTGFDARCQLRSGQLHLAQQALRDQHHQASSGVERARAAAALGQAWHRLGRADQAQPLLEAAEGSADLSPRERAAAALELGNLHLARQRPAAAEAAWAHARQLAPADAELQLTVDLNLLRLPAAAGPGQADGHAPAAADAAQAAGRRLQAAAAALDRLPPGLPRARLTLAAAARAQTWAGATEPGAAPAQALAQRLTQAALEQALAAAEDPSSPGERDALAAQAYDALAALAEAAGRHGDALRLSERGLHHTQGLSARELAVPLEWRAGRLARALGRDDLALGAYRRAVQHIEAVRGDIPVQYQDGRSSFRDTLEPVYLGLTDLLLRQAAQAPAAERDTLLRQARDTVELIKQTELEDYLRDRCSLGSARGSVLALPRGTALLYPIILPDRLELLLETTAGLARVAVPVTAELLRRSALNFVTALRNRGAYRVQAERLHSWLLQPVADGLAQAGVHTLVVVPDGVLRLVPFGALHDGRGFVLERLAVATVPGLTLHGQPGRDDRGGTRRNTLLAGLSEPGPVVDKLPAEVVRGMLDPGTDAAALQALDRSVTAPGPADTAPTAPPTLRSQAVRDAVRHALALPGVRPELADIARVTGGTPLLDQGFTLAALRQQLRTDNPAIVHIASHGVFGSSADTTFIMTWDELLTLDGLQRLLGGQQARHAPIELITLSACQTAEGDDRAPLGMSGTALKARARSALGTLWPVADVAAQQVMSAFYQGLAAPGAGQAALSKAQALRAAQLRLLAQPLRRHPFYWAPFTLVGDWS